MNLRFIMKLTDLNSVHTKNSVFAPFVRAEDIIKRRKKVTVEEKKKILSRYRFIERSIDEHTEELYRWRSKAVKITPGVPGMPQGKGNCEVSKMCLAIEKIEQIENIISQEIAELKLLREKINKAVKGMKEESLKQIIYLRYIKCMTFEDIGEMMSYSWRQILRLHKVALERINLERKETD